MLLNLSFVFGVVFAVASLATPTNAQWNRNRQVRQNCITPEQYYGSCVTLSYCPQVTNIFQVTNRRRAEQYIFALQRSCGTRNIDGDPVVCCTRPITDTEFTERPPNPFLPTEGSFVVPQPVPLPQTTQGPFVNPFLNPTISPVPVTVPPPTTASPLIDPRGSSCRLPSGLLGECLDIYSCPSFIEQLRVKQSDPEFVKYLQAARLICGNKDKNVCCPSGDTVTPTTSATDLVNTNEVPRRLPTVQEGCGYTASTFKKIVGGKVSRKGAWPWIALLGYEGSTPPFKCGGTLITARHIITAAHCLIPDLSFVRLGEHDLTTNTEAQHVDIAITKSVAHPEYNRRNGRSDLAILYLERNVDITNTIRPICMPVDPQLRARSFVDTNPFVIGWGKTQEGGQSSSVLHELSIPVLDNEVCRTSYAKLRRNFTIDQFDKAVLCAGVLSGGKDTCQGDSGGPLMTADGSNTDMRFYLIGIVSYGVGCARPDVPGVYTSTAYFMDWIIQKVKETT